jgi:hypothetical protein
MGFGSTFLVFVVSDTGHSIAVNNRVRMIAEMPSNPIT